MAQEPTSLRIGEVAPAFALFTGDGQEIRLRDILRSRIAIVVFIRGTW
jgi:peroxiredoxin